MIESLSYASEKSGMPPGSLVHVGDVHDHIQSITVINYNASLLEKHTLASADEILPNMPELKWKWGYPALWVVFIAISPVLLMFFRKRKWL
jgi:hypothetical protein